MSEVLDFSKLEAGVFVFEDEAVDLRALIQGVGSLVETMLEPLGRKPLVKVAPSVPKYFAGDPSRIRQVVSNLVSNAIRYSTEGPIMIKARVTDDGGVQLLRVEVEDFGVGIAEDKIEDLFKDFSQVHNSLTSAANGTGLGLAICRRIVDAMHGEIGVESTLGLGSTFWFEIPIQERDAKDAPIGAPNTVQDQTDVELDGLRVLLAEDNVVNQRLISAFLRRLGVAAQIVPNGAVAIEVFQPDKFDLLMFDVSMPEIDGFEALSRIKTAWPEDQVPPVVFLTAHQMPEIHAEAKSLGAHKVLSKPIPFDELKAELEAIVADCGLEASQPSLAVEAIVESGKVAALRSIISDGPMDNLMASLSPEELLELVEDVVSDGFEILDRIRDAHAAGDQNACKNEAHSLVGAARLLGFMEIGESASRIELGIAKLTKPQVKSILKSLEARMREIMQVLTS